MRKKTRSKHCPKQHCRFSNSVVYVGQCLVIAPKILILKVGLVAQRTVHDRPFTLFSNNESIGFDVSKRHVMIVDTLEHKFV